MWSKLFLRLECDKNTQGFPETMLIFNVPIQVLNLKLYFKEDESYALNTQKT